MPMHSGSLPPPSRWEGQVPPPRLVNLDDVVAYAVDGRTYAPEDVVLVLQDGNECSATS